MLEVCDVTKEYPSPGRRLLVLSGVNLSLREGETASIIGPSGSGKSSLLYVLGAMEPPTSGSVRLDGEDPYALGERDMASFRNEKVGFVFQDHHLLPQCTVLENVLVPTLVSREDDSAERRALELIDRVGLKSRLHHRPHELSGGEKQRVALARALIRHPRLVLCDEPTGNLDSESAETVMALLAELHEAYRGILVVVTHNNEIAETFDHRYGLTDGRLRRIGPAPARPMPVPDGASR